MNPLMGIALALAWAFALLCALLIAIAISARLLRGAKAGSKHIVVLVLGDVGRSPRMQYHCLSLADLPADVSLVGYPGEACFPAVLENPRIKQHLMAPPAFLKKLP